MLRTIQVVLIVFFGFLLLHVLFTKTKGILDIFRFFGTLGLMAGLWFLYSHLFDKWWSGR